MPYLKNETENILVRIWKICDSVYVWLSNLCQKYWEEIQQDLKSCNFLIKKEELSVTVYESLMNLRQVFFCWSEVHFLYISSSI